MIKSNFESKPSYIGEKRQEGVVRTAKNNKLEIRNDQRRNFLLIYRLFTGGGGGRHGKKRDYVGIQ